MKINFQNALFKFRNNNTVIICFIGVYIGKKFGNKFNDKAEIIGGIILIIIGLEIFLTNIF